MSILEKIKLHLTIIGVKPAANRALPSFLQHFGAVINIMHVSFVIFTFLTLNISSLWFLISEAVSFTQYSEAVLFYMVTYLHLSFYIISILKRDSILSFIDDLERVIQIRINLTTKPGNYEEANRISESFLNFVWNSMFLFAEMFILPGTLFSFYKYFVLNESDDAFQLLILSTFPWEWKTLRGYLAALCLQCLWLHCIIIMIICTISLFVKLFIMLGAFATDIKENLIQLNDMIDGEFPQTAEEHYRLRAKLIDIIGLQVTANEIIDRFSNIYSSLITVYFGMLMIILCNTLLASNAALFSGLVDIIRSLISLLITMTYISVLCIIGDKTTTHFEEVHQTMCTTLKWNELPGDIQRLLPMIFSMANKPIYIKGYMNVKCTREFMKTITNAGFSYFMMLRGFNQ